MIEDLAAAHYGGGPEAALPPVGEAAEAGNPGEDELSEEMLDAEAAKVVEADYIVGKKLQNELQRIRDRNYQLYRAQSMGNEREGRSKVVSSDVMDQVEWMMPSLMRVFFSTDNICYAEPMTGQDDDIKRARLAPALLNEQFVTHNNGFLLLYKWIKDALIFKAGFCKITWRENWNETPVEQEAIDEAGFMQLQEDKTVQILDYEVDQQIVDVPQQIPDPMTGAPVTVMVQQPQTVYRNVKMKRSILTYEGPDWQVVPPEDLFYDPEAETLADARWVIHRVFRMYSDLKSMEEAGIYKNIERVKAGGSGGRVNTEAETEKQMRFAEEGRSAPFNLTGNAQTQEGLVNYEVLEWYGLLEDPKDDNRPAPFVVTTCNGVTIRRERNPYDHGESPFEELVGVLDVHKLEGISIPEMSGEFQEINTALTRQYLDNLSWQNNGMWEVDRNAQVEMASLQAPRPGGIVRTNRIGSVSPLTPPYIGEAAIRAIEFFDGRHEKRTGQTKYSQGLDAHSLNKTATGITQIMQRSDMRMELIARIIAETGLRRAFRKAHALNRQFMSQQMVVRVLGEPLDIAPDDIKGTADIRITVGVSAAKEQEVSAQTVQLLQMCPNFLNSGVLVPDYPHFLFKKLMEMWHWKDYQQVLPPPNFIQNIVTQLQQAMQTIQAMQQQLAALGVMPVGGPIEQPGNAPVAPPGIPGGGQPGPTAPPVTGGSGMG